MPFTFSHPALVLPMHRLIRRLSLTGLIIGSIAPDFEYFIRLKSKYSHTLAGLFWFDLPLGILLSFLFFYIIRDSLIDNLPMPLKARLIVIKDIDWLGYYKKYWYIVVLSILLGALSHLAWDSFTHASGFFVKKIDTLRKIIIISGQYVPVYRVLQHLSTLVGGVVIFWFIWRLPVRKAEPGINRAYWGAIATVIGVFMYFSLSSDYIVSVWHAVIALVSAGLLSLVIAPLMLKILRCVRRD